MYMLARKKSYTLPYRRELTLVAKWNTLRNTLLLQYLYLCPLFEKDVHFPGDIAIELNTIIFPCIERTCVERS